MRPTKTHKILTGLGIFIFLMAVLLYYAGAARAAMTNDAFLTNFGNGRVAVRLYADFFCGPCKALEPRVEPLLRNLVKKNIINITFIDVPFHKFSSLYTRQYLYIVNEKRDFDFALSVRSTLFEAAKENINEADKLEEYLKQKGIKSKPVEDIKSVFSVFETYMRADNINSTPTCVIERDGKKEIFKGGDDIMKALGALNSEK